MFLKIGHYNTVTVQRLVSIGAYVGDDADSSVLLPRKYLPSTATVGTSLEVFIYLDGENRPIATTQRPKAAIGQFAGMRLIDRTPAGAFMDWGLDKDLFVPHRNQLLHMDKGRIYVVMVYWDERSERIVGTCKWAKLLRPPDASLQPDDSVELLISDRTPLGSNVIVNNAHAGLLYRDDIYTVIRPGDRCQGYIRCIRPDGKLDVTLQQSGYAGAMAASEQVLTPLRLAGGFLPYSAKSSADQISQTFKMSKKTFKRIIGDLYKKRQIILTDDGMRLVDEPAPIA